MDGRQRGGKVLGGGKRCRRGGSRNGGTTMGNTLKRKIKIFAKNGPAETAACRSVLVTPIKASFDSKGLGAAKALKNCAPEARAGVLPCASGESAAIFVEHQSFPCRRVRAGPSFAFDGAGEGARASVAEKFAFR